MTRAQYVISALAALLLVVLATWGAREHKNTQTTQLLDTSMRQAATVAATRTLQIQSLQYVVRQQQLTIKLKDEQIHLATRTEAKIVTVRQPGGATRTESDTVTAVNQDSATEEISQEQTTVLQMQTQLDHFQMIAITASAEVARLSSTEHQVKVDQVKSAPKLAVLLGYDLAELGDPGAPDWWHRARAGLGWPIGLATLGADLAPAYAAQGQWAQSRPEARLDFLFR